MLVEESISSAPWYYVDAGGTEVLSRCSAATTRSLVETWLDKMQLVRALVPEEFLPRMDVPEVFVLYAQDGQQTVGEEIQRELRESAERRQHADASGRSKVVIGSSMRLRDRDMHASIAYIDEALFDPAGMSISPNHVSYLLGRRVPELPEWLVSGIERTWHRIDFVTAPITFNPLAWINAEESDALARDPTRPRAVLPARELFATGELRTAADRHPRRVAVRAATEELFVRWALVSGPQTRAALWKLAAAAAEAPLTDELFESIFGFDYSELRDRLSDYLPDAVAETVQIDPGRQPPLPRIKVERATANQIARLRGEWERLAIGYVQRRMPEVREPYVAQARRTLRRAFDAGDRDPRLLATLGLCEVDAGNDAGAREFLEPATATGVVRPRAYHELARIRFAELRRGAPEGALFSFTELAPIIHPLQRALQQAPPLPEAYVLLAEAWARCRSAPTEVEFAEMTAGAQLFVRRPAVVTAIAEALSRHGRNAEATAMLEMNAGNAASAALPAAIGRLRLERAEPPASAARP